MKQKRKMEKLTADAATTVFPVEPDHSFGHFKGLLREAVEANLGYSISNTLEYCADEQVFWITVGNTAPLGGWLRNEVAHEFDKGTSLQLVKQIRIDPREPIEPQIARALEIQEHVSERIGRLQVLLEQNLQGNLTTP